jgi:hypothetical protein
MANLTNTFEDIDDALQFLVTNEADLTSILGADLAYLDTVGAAQIDDEAVTNAKLAHMATARVKGRATAGTGDAEDLTAAQVITILDLDVSGANELAYLKPGDNLTTDQIDEATTDNGVLIDGVTLLDGKVKFGSGNKGFIMQSGEALDVQNQLGESVFSIDNSLGGAGLNDSYVQIVSGGTSLGDDFHPSVVAVGSPSDLHINLRPKGAGNVRAMGDLLCDAIAELTADAGVTIDGVLLKDGGATLSGNISLDGGTTTISSSELNLLDGLTSIQQQPSEGAFANGDKTKLDGIETGADVTDTGNVTSAGALMDSELTDLAGIKSLDTSTIQLKPSEGAFANGDKTKLDGIEESADVTDATNVNAAGATMNTDTDVSGNSWVLDQDDLSGYDATKVPTQQSVKAYVDALTKTGVYRTIWVDAGAMVARETDGAEAATEEYATNDIMSDHFLFDGATTNEGVQFRVAMPDEWDRSTIKAKFFWDAATGASASDGVVWQIAAGALSNDDAIDAALGTPVHVDDAVTAVGDLHVTAATGAVTVGGSPALGDMVIFEVERLQDDGNDDMAEDAKLLGVQIQYQESSTEPSAW